LKLVVPVLLAVRVPNFHEARSFIFCILQIFSFRRNIWNRSYAYVKWNLGAFAVKLSLNVVSPRKQISGPAGDLVRTYIERCAKYEATVLQMFRSEQEFLTHVTESRGRTRPVLLLADSRGRELSSEDLSAALGRYRDEGAQSLVLAIGPADGWSPAARDAATGLVAFGRITLPHELAAVVAAEQIYRALTILAGHPYHSGH
jgi:23S rRNA (pseudouridine1915-N3)-methyltransferase